MDTPHASRTRAVTADPGAGSAVVRPSMPIWWSADTRDRQRAMVHAAPLYRAAAAQGLVAEDLRHYDLHALALRVVELSLEADGLVDVVSTETLLDGLRLVLHHMDEGAGVPPIGTEARHRRMVERTLEALRNDEARRAEFVETIFDPTVPAPYRREVRFRLLEDRHHPTGGVTIRPTAEAVNLYLRALDVDLASQQHAFEALVAFQLQRGALDAAEQAARDARRASRRYREVLTRELERSERDVTQVDWAWALPRQLDDAMRHLEVRLTQEGHILTTTHARLAELAPATDAALQLVRIRDLMLDTRQDHQQLLGLLIDARQRFLLAQSRQRFRPPVARSVPDPVEDVLGGALRRSPAAVGAALDTVLAAAFPATVPKVWAIGPQLLWNLGEARRTGGGQPGPRHEPNLEDLPPEVMAFPSAVREVGEALLKNALVDAGPDGVLLSDLLRAVYRGDDPAVGAVAHYLALRAVWAADHEAPADGEDREVLARQIPTVAEPRAGEFLVGPFGGRELRLTLPAGAAVASRTAPDTP